MTQPRMVEDLIEMGAPCVQDRMARAQERPVTNAGRAGLLEAA